MFGQTAKRFHFSIFTFASQSEMPAEAPATMSPWSRKRQEDKGKGQKGLSQTCPTPPASSTCISVATPSTRYKRRLLVGKAASYFSHRQLASFLFSNEEMEIEERKQFNFDVTMATDFLPLPPPFLLSSFSPPPPSFPSSLPPMNPHIRRGKQVPTDRPSSRQA